MIAERIRQLLINIVFRVTLDTVEERKMCLENKKQLLKVCRFIKWDIILSFATMVAWDSIIIGPLLKIYAGVSQKKKNIYAGKLQVSYI